MCKTLSVFYDDELLARARAGQHNYSNRLIAAFNDRGMAVELCRNSDAARAASEQQPGYALFHMEHPFHPRALTTRLAYLYPFWRIEASAKRWEWSIARERYDPGMIDRAAAQRFWDRRRRQHFGHHADKITRDGYVYVPLQGRLLDRRSFQTVSPIDMLGETLAHSGDRRVIAALHPNEIYDHAERAALDTLAGANPRLSVVKRPMEPLLRGCDYVVTQNSLVALMGYFLEKPAILFAQIDFHHIALNVALLGIERAFARVADHRPDFAGYLYWFLKQTTINAGDDMAGEQIIAAVRRHGWDV